MVGKQPHLIEWEYFASNTILHKIVSSHPFCTDSVQTKQKPVSNCPDCDVQSEETEGLNRADLEESATVVWQGRGLNAHIQ